MTERLLHFLSQYIPEARIVSALSYLIVNLSKRNSAKETIKVLLMLEKRLYEITSQTSCCLWNGIHPKHKHTKYHEFFSSKMSTNEKVLDIGCGNGSLTYDLARKGAIVTGIDKDKDNIEFAKERFHHENITYIHGDALTDIPNKMFDTIVMSNVLEHITDRICFLKRIQANAQPCRWLIRVPMYERDWRVPLMEEVGVDSRLDQTHAIEYREEQLIDELNAAGLKISHMQICWGEFWCEIKHK